MCALAARAFHFFCAHIFISFVRTKETKQRKSAGCTFWAIPKVVSAEQKELASLKQLFVLYAPSTSSISRPKSEAGIIRRNASLSVGYFASLVKVYAFENTHLNERSNVKSRGPAFSGGA